MPVYPHLILHFHTQHTHTHFHLNLCMQVRSHLRRLRTWSRMASSHCIWRPTMLRITFRLQGKLAVFVGLAPWGRVPLQVLSTTVVATRLCLVRRVVREAPHPTLQAVLPPATPSGSSPTNHASFLTTGTALVSQAPLVHASYPESTRK